MDDRKGPRVAEEKNMALSSVAVVFFLFLFFLLYVLISNKGLDPSSTYLCTKLSEGQLHDTSTATFEEPSGQSA